jgi:hypothetical protein
LISSIEVWATYCSKQLLAYLQFAQAIPSPLGGIGLF